MPDDDERNGEEVDDAFELLIYKELQFRLPFFSAATSIDDETIPNIKKRKRVSDVQILYLICVCDGDGGLFICLKFVGN